MNLPHLLKRNPILLSSVGLMLISIFVKLLGYGEKLILAYLWGTGHEVDVYNLVTTIILSLFFLFREVVEPGYLKVFQELEAQDRRISRGFFNLSFLIIFIVTCLLAIVFLLFPNQVIAFFAPGFNSSLRDTASKLIQIAGPASVFMVLSTLTYISLNAYKKFAIAAVGDLFQKAVILLAIIVFYSRLDIYALAVGIVAGALVRLITHLPVLLKSVQPGFHLCYEKEPLKRVWHLTWPLMIGVLFSQLSVLVDNIFASYLQEGSISALSYSRKLVELPVLLLPYALSVVVFPYLSQHAINGEKDRMKKILRLSIHWIIILFLPLSIFCVLFSTELIELVYQRGAFNDHSTILTARPFSVYAIAMVVFALETIVVVYYFSLGDTKTPIIIGICCSIINITLTYGLISLAEYLGIAIALSISKSIKLGILLFLLYQRNHLAIAFEKQFYIRFLSAISLFALILITCKSSGLRAHFVDGKVQLLIWLVLSGMIAFISYITMVLYPQRQQLLEWLRIVVKYR